jgi:hypothetical protein
VCLVIPAASTKCSNCFLLEAAWIALGVVLSTWASASILSVFRTDEGILPLGESAFTNPLKVKGTIPAPTTNVVMPNLIF